MQERELVLKGMSDVALVKRCAADALGQHPHPSHVRPLLDALASADAQDTHLVHTLRIALRNQLLPADAFATLSMQKLSPAEFNTIAGIAVAVATPQAGEFILNHVNQLARNREELTKYLRHGVRYAAAANVEPLAKLMQEKFAADIDLQLELFQSIRQGLEQRGQPLPDAAKQWGVSLVNAVLKEVGGKVGWTSAPLDPSAPVVTPWDYEPRKCRDGKPAQLLSSLPGGESTTSVLRSKPFEAPTKVSFWLAGHDGEPNSPPRNANAVRLRLVAGDKMIAEARPPRNDTAHKIEWTLEQYAGQQAYLEVTDADVGSAYAWLAIGRIEPAVIKLPKPSPRAMQQRLQFAATTAGQTKLTDVVDPLKKMLADRALDTATRVAAASALATIGDASSVEPMAKIVGDVQELMTLRKRTAEVMGTLPAARNAIVESFRYAPAELQTTLAQALSTDAAGCEALLAAVQVGKAPARLLLMKQINDRLVAANIPELHSWLCICSPDRRR
jgi:hypothetical protein